MSKSKAQQAADGLRNNAPGLGVGLPVVILWAVRTYTGVDMPIEVAGAIAGMMAGAGSMIKRAID